MDAQLKELWADGVATREIGRIIGKTKGAVIGRANRLKLPPRAPGRPSKARIKKSPTPRQRKRAQAIAQVPAKSPKVQAAIKQAGGIAAWTRAKVDAPPAYTLPMPAADDVARKALVDLEPGECHWPVGDPKQAGFGFCGCRAVPGRPYCAGHAMRAVTEPRRPVTPAYEARPRNTRLAPGALRNIL